MLRYFVQFYTLCAFFSHFRHMGLTWNVCDAIGADVLLYLPCHCKQEDICLINSRHSQNSAGFDQPVAQNSTAIS